MAYSLAEKSGALHTRCLPALGTAPEYGLRRYRLGRQTVGGNVTHN